MDQASNIITQYDSTSIWNDVYRYYNSMPSMDGGKLYHRRYKIKKKTTIDMIVEQYFIENKWRKETDENEDATVYYYYALDLADGFSFISSSNDEAKDGEWTVGFFDCYPSMQFDDEYKLDSMIKIATESMELAKLKGVNDVERVEFSADDITELVKGFMKPQEPNDKLKEAVENNKIKQ